MHVKYLIVGNGVAGVNAAKTIAESEPGAQIAIYAAEHYPYYNRWQLPAFLAGELSQEEIYFYPEQWYIDHGITVKLGLAVKAIVPMARQVILADGAEVKYDRLLLAAGSSPAVPPIEGANQAGVFILRTIDHALAIKEYAARARNAIVIGGGLLGLEAARSLRVLGLSVTVVELFPRLLPRQLDIQGAGTLQELIERAGVKVITGAATEQIQGDGKAAGVRLKGGTVAQGELVLISAGIRPNTQLAKEANIQAKRGILVNERMQSSAPDIYAAGDVAEFNGQVYGIIPAAIEQARVAALSMMGADVAPYTGTIPSTTLKVVGIDLTSMGEVNPEGEGFTELRFADRAQGMYRKIVLRNGRIVGAILLGDKKNVSPIARLIKAQTDVSTQASRLSERDFDFRTLFAPAAPQASRYECTVCGYIYDPAKGDPEANVPAGAPFESLPEGWVCPQCGASKAMFTRLED